MIDVLILTGEWEGKEELLDQFLAKPHQRPLRRVVRYTSRPAESHEREGEKYHFVLPSTFIRMAEKGQMIEFSIHRGIGYGTALEDVQKAGEQNHICVQTVDPGGFNSYPNLALGGWIRPFVVVTLSPPPREARDSRCTPVAHFADEPAFAGRAITNGLDRMCHHIMESSIDRLIQISATNSLQRATAQLCCCTLSFIARASQDSRAQFVLPNDG